MIEFKDVQRIIHDIFQDPHGESEYWAEKRDELVEFLGKDEEETLQFIENNIDKFTPEELEEFVDNIENIFFKFYTKTFAQRMRKVADKIKYEDLDEEVEMMENRTFEDEE
jgi:DNA-binding MurR/RpiR family transcriptional regulator